MNGADAGNIVHPVDCAAADRMALHPVVLVQHHGILLRQNHLFLCQIQRFCGAKHRPVFFIRNLRPDAGKVEDRLIVAVAGYEADLDTAFPEGNHHKAEYLLELHNLVVQKAGHHSRPHLQPYRKNQLQNKRKQRHPEKLPPGRIPAAAGHGKKGHAEQQKQPEVDDKEHDAVVIAFTPGLLRSLKGEYLPVQVIGQNRQHQDQ